MIIFFYHHFLYSATVAQEYAKFWVGIESPIINVISRNVPVPAYGRPVSPTTRRPPFRDSVPNYVPISNDQYVRQSRYKLE